MKIYYLRDDPKEGQKKGGLRGCVVVLSKEQIGYSVCHPKDRSKCSKRLARHIALERAKKVRLRRSRHSPRMWAANRSPAIYPVRVPQIIEEWLNKYYEQPENQEPVGGGEVKSATVKV